MQYIIFFLLAALAALLLTPSAVKKAGELGLVDHPEGRKRHDAAMPLAGGLVLFPFIFLGSLISFHSQEYVGHIMAASALIFALGLWDDRFGAHFSAKFLVQVVAALIVMQSGLLFDLNRIPLFAVPGLEYPRLASMFVTLLWIVGITNAVNIIDGMDGLSAGLCFNAFAGMGALALVSGQSHQAAICILMSGALLGFLRYNIHPARTFLGDSGSMLLGFTLAVLSISQSFKTTTFLVFVIPALLLALPMLDTAFAFIRRGVHGRNPFRADLGHLHHRLLELNFSQRQTLGLFYSLSAGMGLIALWLVQTKRIQLLALAVTILILTVAVIKVMQVFNFHEAVRDLNTRMRGVARRAVQNEHLEGERLVRNGIVLSLLCALNLLTALFVPQKNLVTAAALGIFAIGSLDFILGRREPETRFEILHLVLFLSLVLNQVGFLMLRHDSYFVEPNFAISAFVMLCLLAIFIYRSGTFAVFLQDPMEILALYVGIIVCGTAKHFLGTPTFLPFAVALANTLVLYILLKFYLLGHRVRSRARSLGFAVCITVLLYVPWWG